MASRDKQAAELSRVLSKHGAERMREAKHGVLWRLPNGGTFLLATRFCRARDYLNACAELKRAGVLHAN
jgi:hypothetical protein